MPLVLLLVGFLLLALSVALVARALAAPRLRTVEAIGHIRGYGYSPGAAIAEPASPPTRRALDGFASSIGDALLRRFASLKEDELKRQLIAAGMYTMPPRRFLGYQLLTAIAVPALLVWLSAVSGKAPAVVLLAGTLGALSGWVLPRFILGRRAAQRLDEIEYRLPELIDLLVVTVEAGVGFASSLRLAAERLEGPLGDELKLTLQEQNMGLSTYDALRNLVDRCDTPSVRVFVRAVVQSETLGVSIGQTMRNLAVEMRKRRKQKAEERAQKVPVKILFPLVFLIFPALFIVILGPAGFHVFETL